MQGYPGEAGQGHVPLRRGGPGEVPVEEPGQRATVPGGIMGRHVVVDDDQAR